MIIDLMQIPNISQDLQIYTQFNVSNTSPIILSFKRLYRDENSVLLDVYVDDVSEINKIVSSKVLTSNSIIYNPNRTVDFSYMIRCLDIDNIGLPITPNNAHKFYLQFTSIDDGEMED